MTPEMEAILKKWPSIAKTIKTGIEVSVFLRLSFQVMTDLVIV
jgi:hypothetical protein